MFSSSIRITHIIENPPGLGHTPNWNYRPTGHVPLPLLQPGPNGSHLHRRWGTVPEILAESAKHPNEVTLCSADDCACRQLFPAPGILVTAPHTELFDSVETAAGIAAAKLELLRGFREAGK